MNIVYLGAFRFPNGDAAAARVLNNARIFRELGHDVRFVSWGGKYSDLDRCDDGSFAHNGFPYIISDDLDLGGHLLQKLRKYLGRAKHSVKILSELKETPDVVIAYNADYRLSNALTKFCRKKGIKFINDMTEWYDYAEMPIFERPFYWYNMKRLQHRIRNKIVISSYLDRSFPESDNLILPPLCDGTDTKWNTKKSGDKIPPFDGLTLIYAGTPAKKDNIHSVISVVDQLAKEDERIRMIIIGLTKEAYCSQFSPSAGCPELHDNIIFVGRIPQDEVPAYYKQSDFMVLIREQTRKNNAGFPTKVAESITAGVPVITNPTSDLAHYIKDGINGFIVKDSSQEAIYNTLKKVVVLDRRTIDDIKQNVVSTKKHFDWRTYIESTSKFLNNLS